MSQLSTVDLVAIPIFQTGRWNSDEYKLKDLQEMIDAYPYVGFKPPVKAGHADAQENKTTAQRAFGVPSLGFVSNLRISGNKLYADLKNIPRKFAELIKAGAYKRISSEIYWNYKDEDSGKTWPRVLKAVSILGADIPALTSLDEIRALYQGAHEVRTCETVFKFTLDDDRNSSQTEIEGGFMATPDQRIDQVAKSYQQKTGCTYRQGLDYARKSQPELFRQYAFGDSGGGSEQYFESGHQF